MADWTDLNAAQKAECLQIDETAETTAVVAASGDPAEIYFRSEVEQRRYWLSADGSPIEDPTDLGGVLDVDLPSPASDTEVAWYRTALATALGCSEAQADRRAVVLAAQTRGLVWPG